MINNYDIFIVFFSGGKDSIACVLYLLSLGVPPEKIELFHHDVDGKGETFMDYEVTPAYCQAFADAFGIKIYFSWKEGGFLREMLRENQLTAPNFYETPDGIKSSGGTTGKPSTRRKFPQVSPDLQTRWCSAYLKIDVASTGINNQIRFKGKRTLIVSGERSEESDKNFYKKSKAGRKGRGSYATFEAAKTNSKERYMDHWRPLLDWFERDVWEIIERYKVRVHPCYYMGWSRCSCKFCIFGGADQFASAYTISPQIGEKMIELENDFGYTLKRNTDLRSLIESGTPYTGVTDELARIATSYTYELNIIMDVWELPLGAYGQSCGPN